MANVFKYLTGNPSRKALKKGNLARGIGGEQYGPTSQTGYYAGVDAPEGGYVITTLNGSNLPEYRVAHNDNELIPIANNLGGNVSTIAAAKSYLAGRNNTWLINSTVNLTVTDGLIFHVDARSLSSYPTTGNNWYDLSPSQNNSTYYYNNSNIIYEDSTKSMYRGVRNVQADHYRSGTTVNLDGDFTMIVLAKVEQCHNRTANGLLTNHSHAHKTGAGITVKTITDNDDFRISCNTGNGSNRTYHTYYGTSNIKDKWSHLMVHYSGNVLSLWVNGVKEYTRTYSMASRADYIDLFNWSTTYNYSANYRPKCKIQYGQVYDKALSSDEINTSYHQGNIVTNNLLFAIDAGNLVSYENGSTNVKSLVSSDTATLVNGVVYSHSNGGTWDIDASNEKIVGPTGVDWFTNKSFTIEGWINPNSSPKSEQVWFAAVGPTGGIQKNIHLRIYSSGQLRFGFYGNDLNTAGGVLDFNKWNHIVFTYDFNTDTSKVFHNGKQAISGTQGPFNDTSANINIGYWQSSSGQTFDGKLAVNRIYSKPLSSDEVLQNFNAQRSRFGL